MPMVRLCNMRRELECAIGVRTGAARARTRTARSVSACVCRACVPASPDVGVGADRVFAPVDDPREEEGVDALHER
eukprot:5200502-Pleurochrysis_carterae.AAC.1